MNQEDKELLLQDLCARLPYGVICGINGHSYELVDIDIKRELVYLLRNGCYTPWSILRGDDVKPYLRPMSSMTEEEKKELKTLFDAEEVTSDSICYLEGGTLEEYLSHISYSFCSKIIDWLNAHHFDYRGLIEKGLAIAVTEENNPYKD